MLGVSGFVTHAESLAWMRRGTAPAPVGTEQAVASCALTGPAKANPSTASTSIETMLARQCKPTLVISAPIQLNLERPQRNTEKGRSSQWQSAHYGEPQPRNSRDIAENRIHPLRHNQTRPTGARKRGGNSICLKAFPGNDGHPSSRRTTASPRRPDRARVGFRHPGEPRLDSHPRLAGPP